jgi:hypothetical protein
LIYTSASPFGATQVDTKNLFELKCATNVQVDSNIFIHHRRGSDIGYSLWLKTVNQDGNGWACQTKNVTIEKNIWSDINGWAELHGQEASGNPFPGPMTNVTLRNNLVYGSLYTNGGDISAFNISQAATNVTVDHNTVINVTDGLAGGMLVVDSTSAHLSGFVFQNNMVRSETYGIHDPTASGDAALAVAAPGFVFRNNGVGAGTVPPYTSGNGNVYSSLATWEAAFTTYSDDGSGGADYTVLASGGGTNYHNAGSDGKDIGADIAAVTTATTGVAVGTGSTLAITLPLLPTGVRTVAYSSAETASGGSTPYSFAVTVGARPTGTTLASNGTWSGTPTASGSFTFTVTVTDNVGAQATQQYTVQILEPVTISTTSPLTAGILNIPYTQAIVYTGGQSPFQCSVSSGSLPTGITLNQSTCTLSGVPTLAGSSSFTVTVSGALGSTASLVATLSIAGETLPVGRPTQTGPIPHEAAAFRRPTAPTGADGVAYGDIWVDTSKSPPVVNLATSSAPTWMAATLSGSGSTDGSQLINLNATQLTSGTVPNTALPADVTISSSATVPTANVTNENVAGRVVFADTNCNTLSLSGQSALCQDITTHTLQLSQNGGAYGTLGAGSSSSSGTASALANSDNTVTFQFAQTDNTNPYGMGESTANGRSATWSSLQGAQWQVLRFHDSTVAATDYSWGLGVSNNTGSTWIWPWKVRQDGLLNFGDTGLIVNGTTAAGTNGMPVIVGKTGLLATQGANITVTTLYAVPVGGAGLYRVCANEAVTRAATTSSTMPAVTISWNNGVAQTTTLIASSGGNVTTTVGQACATVRAAASTNISYDAGTTTGAFASSGATSMQFELSIVAEYLN